MLIAKKSRQVVLNLKNPSRVTTVIPTARVINYKGTNLVAVPHRLDETRVLRNLGFKVPSPATKYYPFPGKFKPFAHQLQTVDFLTTNTRAYCLNDMGCVDSETEYLSPTGWVPIAKYRDGLVAQYLPDSGGVEFVAPTEFVKIPCNDMVRIKTKYGVDQVLSPEHRVLLSTRSDTRMEVVSAEELLKRHDAWVAGKQDKKARGKIGYCKAAIPVTFTPVSSPAGVPLDAPSLRVQVAVIADGSFPSKTGNRCIIRVKRDRKKERIRQLLKDANISFSETSHDYPTAVGYTVFTLRALIRLKEFDERFWAASLDQLRVIADEVMHWDGSVSHKKPTERFSTTVKASADFIQYAFAATGRTARIVVGRNDGSRNPVYEVLVRRDGLPLQLCSLSSDGTRRPVMEKCASTDGFKYCFRVPSTFLLFRRNGCIFASGNTAKTLSSLWAYDYLRSEGWAGKLLVTAPLSTLENVWGNEIWHNLPHLTFQVLHGDRKKRLKLLKEDADIYIINHDGLEIIQKDLQHRYDITHVIIDEMACYRNRQTEKWDIMNNIINGPVKRNVWGMTGTPTPNAPTDAWGQCKLLTPASVPIYFGKFRDMTMRKVTQFRWVERENALDIVKEAMQPAIRFSRDECIDLPPVTYETMHVELTKEQKELHKAMLNALVAEFKGQNITAVNEAVKLNKLVQICCGCVYDDHTERVFIPVHPRINLVKEIVEDAGGKCIVFVPYTGPLEQVANELRKHFSVETVHGGTTHGERSRIFTAFQSAKDPRVLVANAGTMSHGLTLTASNTVIWFAPPNSNEVYNQANARITRPGQKLNQLIIHIEGTDTERRMYDRLKKKTKLQGVLLDMIEQMH